MNERQRRVTVAVVVLVAVVATLVTLMAVLLADGDEAPVAVTPRIDLIDEALRAVGERYGGPQPLFEVSADLAGVSVVVAREAGTDAESTLMAEQLFYDDGVLSEAESLGEAAGATFFPAAVMIETRGFFDEINADLDDPVISDVAITGGPDGAVVYDATVLSDEGGVLLVLLGGDGRVQGVQPVAGG